MFGKMINKYKIFISPLFKVKNKKGFLRIVEAFIAIIIIAGVLLFLYTGRVPQVSDEETIYPIIRVSLKEITTDNELRRAVLNVGYTDPAETTLDTTDKNYIKINESFYSTIPEDYDYYFCICNIEVTCGIDSSDPILLEKDIFSNYVVIFTTPDSPPDINPKKLRLFIWEKG